MKHTLCFRSSYAAALLLSIISRQESRFQVKLVFTMKSLFRSSGKVFSVSIDVVWNVTRIGETTRMSAPDVVFMLALLLRCALNGISVGMLNMTQDSL